MVNSELGDLWRGPWSINNTAVGLLLKLSVSKQTCLAPVNWRHFLAVHRVPGVLKSISVYQHNNEILLFAKSKDRLRQLWRLIVVSMISLIQNDAHLYDVICQVYKYVVSSLMKKGVPQNVNKIADSNQFFL